VSGSDGARDLRRDDRPTRRWTLAALALALSGATAAAACRSPFRRSTLPATLSDDDFWKLTTALSEPPGEFAGVSRLSGVELLDKDGTPATCYFPGDPITIAIELELTRRVELPYFLISIAGTFGPIAAASMFHDGCRPPFIEGRYRIECTFERLILAPRQRFTVRFALYAEDATTIVYPKQVIATFVTSGSAADCGFFHKSARGRILGGPPVLADYRWRMAGGIESAWTSANMPGNTAATAVEGAGT